MPQYIGGIEHAILHLLYARFMTHALNHLGLISHKEPFEALLAQGMVLSATHRCVESGRYLHPDETETDGAGAVIRRGGGAVTTVMEKMSKSKHNGVEPSAVVEKWGADTARLFVLFKAPPAAALEWDDRAIAGQHRWLGRVWTLVHECCSIEGTHASEDQEQAQKLRFKIHSTIQQVTRDIFETQTLNTAVASLMELSNTLSANPDRQTSPVIEGVCALVTMLAPFAPHAASAMWEKLKESAHDLPSEYCKLSGVHQQRWPAYSESMLQQKQATVVVQIQGKKRGTFQVPVDMLADLDGLEQIARETKVVKKWVEGKTIKRIIIPKGGRIVNFVI